MLKYNHLLKGPEHKKKRQLAADGKNYSGGIVYGTPGLVLILEQAGSTTDVNEFLSISRDVGKRAHLVHQLPVVSAKAALVASMLQARGLKELTVADAQELVGGAECFKTHILGLK
jgi:hypothetical protein